MAEDLIDGPSGGRDRRDAEALVDAGSGRVVDASDHVLDLIGLAGGAGDHDVRVVAARDGDHCVGPLNASGDEGVSIEAPAEETGAGAVPGPITEQTLSK